jgi:hypothetical protein
MNADFEPELAASAGGGAAYRRPSSFVALNRRLAPHLLRLAERGDALLVEEAPPESFISEAARRGVELVTLESAKKQAGRIFTPWGWTHGVVALGRTTSARRARNGQAG